MARYSFGHRSPFQIQCRLFVVLLLLMCIMAFENCDQECKNAVTFSNLGFYSTRGVILSGMCFNQNQSRTHFSDIQVQKFPLKSLWIGAYLQDLWGSSLSPLFIAHGRNLSCTEYEISRIKHNKISLSLKHFYIDKFDFRFEFNQSGWIEYGNRYGCPSQVNATRIIDTDYVNFVLIYGCADVSYQNGYHLTGFLLLFRSIHIANSIWIRLEAFFYNMSQFDRQNYTLPERSTLLKSRETGDCQDFGPTEPHRVICNKQIIRNMLEAEKEVVKDIKKIQRNRPKGMFESDRVLVREITYDEISCLVSLFVVITLCLYWTHFSM